MSISGIIHYAGRAGLTALAVCAAWAGLRLFWLHLRRRKWRLKNELGTLLGVFYLAALIEITVWRGGDRIGERILRCIPLETTLAQLGEGLWPFFYHLIGNIVWFVPLGVLIALKRPGASPLSALLSGAVLSAGIEIAQFLRCSGVSDIDDVLTNALGALIGLALTRLILRLRRSGRKTADAPRPPRA